MLIVALVLAVIGLAALVTAVVTSNEVVAWVCIGASALGVVLLVVDAIRERQQRRVGVAAPITAGADADSDDLDDVDDRQTTELAPYPDAAPPTDEAPLTDEVPATAPVPAVDEVPTSEQQAEIEAEAEAESEAEAGSWSEVLIEDHPDEVVHDEPEYDTYDDDEPEFPAPAEESAMHVIDGDAADGDQDGEQDAAAEDAAPER